MSDKRATLDDMVGELRDGMTIGLGGWGSRRKPMAAVRAILRAGVGDLTVVSYGGPDVGLLCAAGRVRKVVYSFVTLDSIALDPHFRVARQTGTIEAMEIDEGMFYLGLLAASQRVPFLPTRAGLGSDVLRVNPELRTVRSPYDDGEELVAMRALELHAALVHVHRADASGNAQILGPDPYFDDLFCMAARRRIVSCERVVRTEELLAGGSLYWVIRGEIAAREKLIAIEPFRDRDGIGRCRLVMQPKVIAVSPRPMRAFQGWRYFTEDAAPPDLGKAAAASVAAMPEPMRRELRDLGLL